MNVKVIHQFLPQTIFFSLSEYILTSNNWSFSGRSKDVDEPSFWFLDLTDSPYVDPIVSALSCANESAEHLLAFYANGQTYGQAGSLHTDANDAEIFTCLIYCNPHWKSEWGGRTVFYPLGRALDEHNEFSVIPEPNKAVVFNATLPHLGLGPSSDFRGLRVTCAFKYRRRLTAG